jgi:hypothetical protein
MRRAPHSNSARRLNRLLVKVEYYRRQLSAALRRTGAASQSCSRTIRVG